MKALLFQLSDSLTNFDYGYAMSDSHKVFTQWNKAESKLIAALKDCTPSELTEIYNNLASWVTDINCILISYIKDNMATAKVLTIAAPKNVSFRSLVFITAHAYVNTGTAKNMSTALKMAWSEYRASKNKMQIAA